LSINSRTRSILLTALLVVLIFHTASAQESQTGPTDPQELEVFMDGLLLSQLDSFRIAGAVVSVVKDGEIFFSKGYGYSDVETQTRVLPDQTLFRPGSVTKVVVWTAVMQLVEQGQIDLYADIQIYLDFPIPDTYSAPITMAHLMTHTAGFEEAGLGTFVLERDQKAPLGEYLRNNVPDRIYPPGQIAAYSNYGSALAGYIIERVSGMPYEDYIRDNIFVPLEMSSSTLYQPPPGEIPGELSKGNMRVDGRFQEGRFEYVQASPAGALSATAGDIANFMIAHLQGGRFLNTQILQTETVQEMHSRQFSHHSDVNGMTYGWMEIDFNGVRGISHGGNTVFFHTIILLLPDQNLGLYASYNSPGGAEASFRLMYAFLERYFSSETTDAARVQIGGEGFDRFSGSYYPTRHNQSGFEKILLLSQPIQVSETEAGLLLTRGVGPEPWYWEQVGEYEFKNIETPQRLVFDRGEDGSLDRFYISDFPPVAFLRTPWHLSPSLHFLLLGITLPIFFFTVLVLPVSYLSTRPYRKELNGVNPLLARLAALSAWLFSLLVLVFVTGLLVMLMNPEVILGLPPWAEIFLTIPWVLLILAVFMAAFGILAWMRGYWGIVWRVLYSLAVLSGLLFIAFLIYWNLLPLAI
jgi:CubicO group peptidase (beta-lactamase class C family)